MGTNAQIAPLGDTKTGKQPTTPTCANVGSILYPTVPVLPTVHGIDLIVRMVGVSLTIQKTGTMLGTLPAHVVNAPKVGTRMI